MNMRAEEGHQITFTLHDYRARYEEEVANNKSLTERVAALEGAIAVMQGKDRPRPPRPLN